MDPPATTAANASAVNANSGLGYASSSQQLVASFGHGGLLHGHNGDAAAAVAAASSAPYPSFLSSSAQRFSQRLLGHHNPGPWLVVLRGNMRVILVRC